MAAKRSQTAEYALLEMTKCKRCGCILCVHDVNNQNETFRTKNLRSNLVLEEISGF